MAGTLRRDRTHHRRDFLIDPPQFPLGHSLFLLKIGALGECGLLRDRHDGFDHGGVAPMPRICATTASSMAGAETERVGHLFQPCWCAVTQT